MDGESKRGDEWPRTENFSIWSVLALNSACMVCLGCFGSLRFQERKKEQAQKLEEWRQRRAKEAEEFRRAKEAAARTAAEEKEKLIDERMQVNIEPPHAQR